MLVSTRPALGRDSLVPEARENHRYRSSKPPRREYRAVAMAYDQGYPQQQRPYNGPAPPRGGGPRQYPPGPGGPQQHNGPQYDQYQEGYDYGYEDYGNGNGGYQDYGSQGGQYDDYHQGPPGQNYPPQDRYGPGPNGPGPGRGRPPPGGRGGPMPRPMGGDGGRGPYPPRGGGPHPGPGRGGPGRGGRPYPLERSATSDPFSAKPSFVAFCGRGADDASE